VSIPLPVKKVCLPCGKEVALKSNGRFLTHVNPATQRRCEGSHSKPDKLVNP